MRCAHNRGERAIVLLVAPDGTTVSVSALGQRMQRRIDGWPSTAVLDDILPGPAPATSEQLLGIARSVQQQVLAAQRSDTSASTVMPK